jgi:prevent-host-death family protein
MGSMTSIGSFEAKTHLSELLDRVSQGEKIVITKRGHPVAMLVPLEKSASNLEQVIAEMLAWRDREGPRLGPKLTIRELINEGRR